MNIVSVKMQLLRLVKFLEWVVEVLRVIINALNDYFPA